MQLSCWVDVHIQGKMVLTLLGKKLYGTDFKVGRRDGTKVREREREKKKEREREKERERA